MNGKIPKWQVWIDTGGTFTDCIGLNPEGAVKRLKVLSSSKLRGKLTARTGNGIFSIDCKWPAGPETLRGYSLSRVGDRPCAKVIAFDATTQTLVLDQDLPFLLPSEIEITAFEEAPVLAARLLTQTPFDQPLPPLDMRLGSTKGTNALLEKKGAGVTFLVTRGFADLMYIGTQQRPNLFQLHIPEPELLYIQVIEVEERLDAAGKVVIPLTEKEIDRVMGEIQHAAVAVALLHAYANPVHEQTLGERLREKGIRYRSLSHELSPNIKILPRAQTALVNAYLSPVLETYLGKVLSALHPDASLLVMTSAGGLIPAAGYRPKDSLLSGPAGGMVGAAAVASALGFERILTFDMGGTSTDTARYDGRFDYRFLTRIDGIEMQNPSLAIETVAAGGGSICYFDGQKLGVGPESAGADPGPACYGAGGPLTITDVNLLLGKLNPAAMSIPIDEQKAWVKLRALQTEILDKTGVFYPEADLLKGFEQIADEKMAAAINRISVAKGFDPAEYALLAFGGAGGLHACHVAELLGVKTIILPYDAGLLSAFGMGMAQVERLVEKQILLGLETCGDLLTAWVDDLSEKARCQLMDEGFERPETTVKARMIYLRLKGQESALELAFMPGEDLKTRFIAEYRRLFGHFPDGAEIEVESIKVLAATVRATEKNTMAAGPSTPAVPVDWNPDKGAKTSFPVFNWNALTEGAKISGPAVIANPTSTTFIGPGWEAGFRAGKHLVMTFGAANFKQRDFHPLAPAGDKAAIELELFTNRFTAIAEEMGAQLQRTAFSVNVRERLDFSCAVLDPDGKLLVNAPHIPVHLGSLGICARLTLAHTPLEPGDVLLVNHPKYGGSHLPDLTLLCGAYTDDGALIGYVINRAHHAEIGGKRPGSMPPEARCLAEEGVVFPPTYLARKGEMQWAHIREMLTQSVYPSRAPRENLADLNAALSSLLSGVAALRQLAGDYGLGKIHANARALQDHAGNVLKDALKPLEGSVFEAEEKMDDGTAIKVRISVKNGGMEIDLRGASPVHPGNLNANIAIVYSAVIYVLRLLTGREIPLNEGLMQDIRIQLGENTFLHPDFSDDPEVCPAVVGGNIETSQRLVDTLLKALGLSACSQGTMNNFLFGNETFGYYETIGGGVGAGPGFHGRSGVHQHMTNTRITDPEEMERRYPVRLWQFGLRKGSGGNGNWKGGDGVIREVEFLAPVEVTVLSQHRKEKPYGLAGGEPGQCGRQVFIKADGVTEELQGVDSRSAEVGDRIVIYTPGGGGYGKKATLEDG